MDDLNKDATILISFNWDSGSVKNVYEMYVQLKNSGQIDSELKFFEFAYEILKEWSVKKLPKKAQEYVAEAEKLLGVVMASSEAYAKSIESANILEMIQGYEKYSFSHSHRVLMIAHGQGNIFANKIYEKEADWKKDYMQIEAIASIADHIASDPSKSYYVSNFSDKVVTLTPNALTPTNVNSDGDNGHDLVDSYLMGDKSSIRITNDLNQLLKKLKETKSQWNITNKSQEGTSEYRGIFTHKFNTMMDQKFGYIFKDDNDAAYVYQVADPDAHKVM
jgi:hypothetical protein